VFQRYSVILFLGLLPLAHGQDLSPHSIDQAIRKAAAYLLKRQQADGSWVSSTDELRGYRSGTTALALLALLTGDVSPKDIRIRRGFAYLIKQPINKTYEAGLICMALHALCEAARPKGFRRANSRSKSKRHRCRLNPTARKWLRRVAVQLMSSHQQGSWGYQLMVYRRRNRLGWPQRQAPKGYDHSNSQYALLGLRAAALCGIRAHPRHWQAMLTHFLKSQRTTKKATQTVELSSNEALARGWAYTGKEQEKAYMTMTCAGLASLVIAREQLALMKRLSPKDDRRVGAAVRDGLAWINQQYHGFNYAKAEQLDGYRMYGVERVGVLLSIARLGKRDWYRNGALALLRLQKDGAFAGRRGALVETSFALLFLKKATTPLRIVTRISWK